jgi:hypothetical protein
MTAKHSRKKKEDDILDDAVEDSFPASDPPAMTVPTVPGAPTDDEDEDEEEEEEEYDDEDEDEDEDDEEEEDE